MRGLLVIAALIVPLSLAEAATPHPPTRGAPAAVAQTEALRQAIVDAYQRMQANDLQGAADALDTVIGSSAFARLDEKHRYIALALAGGVALRREQPDAAHPLLVRATASPEAESDTWHLRLSAAYATQRYDDGALCVTTIARRWPQTLGDINDYAIYRIAAKLGEARDAQARQRDMLGSLFAAEWQDSGGEPSELWRDLVRLQLAKGDLRTARSVAARIRAPRIAVGLCVDKRFDRLTRKDTALCEIDRLAAAAVTDARAKVRAAPDRLKPLVSLQAALIDTMQLDEAVALADAAIAKARDASGKSPYPAFDDEYVWVLDLRALALARLGRWDEALTQRQRAARRPEHGAMNVSQAINLAELCVELGRPDEALEAIVELGPTSPFGRMQLELVQLGAAVQRKDAAAVAAHLAFMREHRADAIGAWQSALLTTGDTRGGAALLVERLEREDWRNDALVAMQDYARATTTPMIDEWKARWRAVIADPKVQAALARTGRLERFNVGSPAF